MKGKDDAREERIYMEAVVDAHDSEERAMGWYYYLEDKIMFHLTRNVSPQINALRWNQGSALRSSKCPGKVYANMICLSMFYGEIRR